MRWHLLAVSTMGTGAAATLSGPISAAAFHEPLGMAVACGVLYVACYGGGCGAVVAVSRTTFAVKLLEALSNLYDAGGFVPPGASEARRAARHMPLSSALDMFEHSIRFLSQTCEARSRSCLKLVRTYENLCKPVADLYEAAHKRVQTIVNLCELVRIYSRTCVNLPANLRELPVNLRISHRKLPVNFPRTCANFPANLRELPANFPRTCVYPTANLP